MKKRLSRNVTIVTMIGLFIAATGVLAEEENRSETTKYKSKHPDKECVYGEAICGVAWEGKGLFEIKGQWLDIKPDNVHSMLPALKKSKVDLRTAYLCCNEDGNRLNICNAIADSDPSQDFFASMRGIESTRGVCRAWVAAFASIPDWRGLVNQMGDQKVRACMDGADDFVRALVISQNEALFSSGPDMQVVPVTITDMPLRLGTLFFDERKFTETATPPLTSVFDELMSQKGADIIGVSEKAGDVKQNLKYHLENDAFSALGGQKLSDRVLKVIFKTIDEQFNDDWAELVDRYQLIGNPDYELPDDQLYPTLKLINKKTSPMYPNNVITGDIRRSALWMREFECVGEIFDTLRDDPRGCLWNQPDKEFCDQL
jgi:hypothetical protein